MRIMMLIAVILTAVTSTAKADWAYTKWGMTPEQVAKASNGAVHVLPAAERPPIEPITHVQTVAVGTYTDGDLPLRVEIMIDTKTNGMVCANYAVLDEKKNSALRALLIKRYGQPKRAAVDAWETPDEVSLESFAGAPAFVSHCKKN